jgi:hypothetical protein
MQHGVVTALEAIEKVRGSRGFRGLDAASRRSLDGDLRRIEQTLQGGDPYARALDLFDPRQPAGARPSEPPAAPARPPPPATAEIGARTAAALEAVDFPAFVASLIHGTFDAIVDASIKQIHEYARLVASLTQSLDAYTQDNVSLNAARDRLAEKHPSDLYIEFPKPGESVQPRLLPRPEREGESPAWLAQYGLAGQELNAELTEGALLDKGRLATGEERLQALATTVLMGINRIVVSEGDVRAKLQFHATARDSSKAEAQQLGLAARGASGANTQMMVSTLKANAQTDASIKADLMGEVRISFRSETFPLERFADGAAIQLLSRHARWKGEPVAAANALSPAAASVPSAAPVAPTPSPQNGSLPGNDADGRAGPA